MFKWKKKEVIININIGIERSFIVDDEREKRFYWNSNFILIISILPTTGVLYIYYTAWKEKERKKERKKRRKDEKKERKKEGRKKEEREVVIILIILIYILFIFIIFYILWNIEIYSQLERYLIDTYKENNKQWY